MYKGLTVAFITMRPALCWIQRVVSAQLLALLTIVFVPTASRSGDVPSYPERPIKIIVPFPAGGPTDVAARTIAQGLSPRLGQSLIVENLAGAGGRTGAKAAATANPDGYTLLLGGTNINVIMGALYKNLGFDPIDSFAPIAAIAVDSMALAISPRVPVDTFQQFVQYAKDNPGKLKYGAPPGIYTHLASEFLKVRTGMDILFVPYKGAAPVVTDVLGGHIEMVFNAKSVLLPHVKEGRLKALAVTSASRWPELPMTPTMKELGIEGFPKEIWFGLLAPAGTSSAIIGKLNHAAAEALVSPEAGSSLAKLGMEARIGTPQDFAAALAEQIREWKSVLEATGIKAE
jgi:tripartite-type tricarboxylate transporter receptor subunit TctC